MRTSLAFLFSIVLLNISAQKASKAQASIYYEQQDYLKAKEYIDQAILNEKDKAKQSTWYLRGDIYNAIVTSRMGGEDLGVVNPEVEAFQAYKKALDFGEKSETRMNNTKRKMVMCKDIMMQEAVFFYNEGKFEESLYSIQNSLDACHYLKSDSTLESYTAAMIANKLERDDLVEKYYEDCIDRKYELVNSAEMLSMHYSMKNDYTNAHRVLDKAIKKHRTPDFTLTSSKLNLYLSEGKYAESLPYFETALSLQPDNYILYFARGSVLEQLGKPAQAEADYLKSLELKPDNFDANYNLGALYFNRGVEFNSNAPEDFASEEYEKMILKRDAEFKKALGYFEKAQSIEPDDRGVLMALKNLYGQLNMMDEYMEVKKKLE
jgi:tetratricopeptide (TPR) repeat protein